LYEHFLHWTLFREKGIDLFADLAVFIRDPKQPILDMVGIDNFQDCLVIVII